MANTRYVVRVDPSIWRDVEFADSCSISARGTYFDSLFYLASIGDPKGIYSHVNLSVPPAVADELTSFGVWRPDGDGWLVEPYSGCRVTLEARAWIPDELRQKIYARDGYRCLRCGATESLSLDHIHPWSKGGTDTEENLRTLCRSCNSSKGDRI